MKHSRLTRRDFLRSACAGALAAAVPIHGQAASTNERPNIVVILTDDQGWGDLSLHGNVNLATPNVDSLARDGAMFDRFFVCAVCAPTRAEFLTGRYHPRGGVHGVTTGAERLNVDEKTIGDTFKAAGYATAAFGKWHNGTQYPYHPNGRGFDEYYGFCSGHWGNYFDPILEHNGKIVRGKGYIIDDLTDHALEFIEQNRNRPFFCYLPYNTPHSPMQVPDHFFDRFKHNPIKMRNRDPQNEQLEKTRCALAMCENIDWNVGRVLKKLEDLKLASNTIVIYFSDNGPNSWRWNGGMKGRKGSTDEGGVRVPCAIRWPGHIKPGKKISRIAGAIDLLPTLADVAGIKIVGSKPLDGISIKPLLLTEAKNWPDRMIFSHQRGRISVRTQRYRLDHTGKLFDMKNDPGQNRDISKDKPQVAERLRKAVARWKDEVLAESPKDDRPFPVGYAAFPTALLPARDGIPHGNVRRSAKAPNCSYFTNWISQTDKITWDIEVASSGNFEAVVYYTCPVNDVGSTVELSFDDSRIRGKVIEPHDPPSVGAEFDRFDRGSESFVKDFRPLRLGVFRLEKGRGELTLRALDVPGKQVMDVRLVALTLLK
ncbi:MAG: N-acetylgalactosamine 6-sulfate sulfatase [Planctomycetes bacterium B3_Pla]|nr:MAG: N-acetylgalactosamine 6-sulfate sulfatase [Planctomycetes bacterium B3_Pla]